MEHSPGISNIKEQSISAVEGVNVSCSSPSVSVKRCSSLLITLALKSSEQSDFDCVLDEEKTKGAQKEVHEMLPPPSTNKTWVQKAVAIISKFSGMNVVN
uniref:Uncharacterized protein n=1 Tax=Amphimedon queenslandica TaxID=400682 RepID=A0A1X7VTJ5_AMPQE